MFPLLISAALTASPPAAVEQPKRIGIRLHPPPQMPPALIAAMMRDTERRWAFPSLKLHWHGRDEPCQGPDHRLVIVEFHGRCTLHRFPDASSRRALGYTLVSDGDVLPFIGIDCDAIAASVAKVSPALSPFLNINVFGRALAAVLTHEMIHALTESGRHEAAGVMQPNLTPRDLTEPDLPIPEEALYELEESLGVPLASSLSQERLR